MLTLAITSIIFHLLGAGGLCLLICLITESSSLTVLPDSLLSCDELILINGIAASDLQRLSPRAKRGFSASGSSLLPLTTYNCQVFQNMNPASPKPPKWMRWDVIQKLIFLTWFKTLLLPLLASNYHRLQEGHISIFLLCLQKHILFFSLLFLKENQNYLENQNA